MMNLGAISQKVLPTACLRLTTCRAITSSSASSIAPPAKAPLAAKDPKEYGRTPEDIRLVAHSGEESIYKLGKHRSNAMELVHKVPIVEVEGEMAICDGGGGALGHPLEYISLKRPGAVEYCKYCALRFTKKMK